MFKIKIITETNYIIVVCKICFIFAMIPESDKYLASFADAKIANKNIMHSF